LIDSTDAIRISKIVAEKMAELGDKIGSASVLTIALRNQIMINRGVDDMQYALASFRLSRIEMKKKNHREAVNLLQGVQDIAPEGWTIRLQSLKRIAKAYHNIGLHKQAEDALKKVVNMDPDEQLYVINKSLVYGYYDFGMDLMNASGFPADVKTSYLPRFLAAKGDYKTAEKLMLSQGLSYHPLGLQKHLAAGGVLKERDGAIILVLKGVLYNSDYEKGYLVCTIKDLRGAIQQTFESEITKAKKFKIPLKWPNEPAYIVQLELFEDSDKKKRLSGTIGCFLNNPQS